MMYLLVVSIRSPKEKIYTRTLVDLTLYEITALVNLSAKTMVKFRPFLKRPTFLHPWQRVWLEEPPGRTRGEGMGARRALAWMTTGGPDRRALPRVNRHSSVETIRSPRARSKRKRSVSYPWTVSQCGDLRCFASRAERPGSGSPRTTMFGVNSALHAASRSAHTSSGAVRNSATACLTSVGSTLHR
jgi:hypothetical protein